ncbi:MAG: PD-(D/E)XK nuclease domain-containing protein [Limisphaerales bacterium]
MERICQRFHSVARQLRNRHEDRASLEVNDEYDVQDLLHALLRIHFSDIRPEEWAPSYAGTSSRMDFLLKDEKIVVEVKKTRKTLKEKDVVDQLIVDCARYREHPDCETLVCFVYDPDGWIGNAAAIKKDIEKIDSKFQVRVFVYPET